MASALDYLIVVALGASVGIGELVSRYRDAPVRALRNRPAFIYIGVNAAAAALSLALVRVFDWEFGLEEGDAVRWTQVIVAGLGAMALLRSAIFRVRVGDQDVGVGASSFLEVVLSAADRAVDRRQAGVRARTVGSIMTKVSFVKAQQALPTLCLALMQNLPPEDQATLARQIEALGRADMEESAKAVALGLALVNAVGEDVLAAAVECLGDEILGEAAGA